MTAVMLALVVSQLPTPAKADLRPAGRAVAFSVEAGGKSSPKPPEPKPPVPPKPDPDTPYVTVPAEVKAVPGKLIAVKADTNGDDVIWIGLDQGLDVVPADKLKDPKELLAYTSLNNARFRVVAVAAKNGKVARSVECIITVGDAPVPPGPTPPGPNPPGPTPTPTNALRVLLVYESLDNMTPKQLSVLGSTAVTEYMNRKCIKDDNRPGWRRWDKDVNTDKESETWKALWNATKPSLGKLPQVIIFQDKKGTAYPLPDSEADMLKLLKQYGGE